MEGFIRIHRVHPQPWTIPVGEGATAYGQFGVCAFYYRTGVEVPVQAQRNRWSSNWHEGWFYYQLEGEPELTGEMPLLGDAKAEAVMGDEVHAAYDAVRLLARYQSARDLMEEFCAARVLPLKADQEWFAVEDSPRYEERGLKGLKVPVLDVKAAWADVVKGTKTEKITQLRIYGAVMSEVEDLVGKLGASEIKAIASSMAGRARVNQIFDLLGVSYEDRPVPVGDGDKEKKKKRAREEVTGDDGGVAKTGRGRGRKAVSQRGVSARSALARTGEAERASATAVRGHAAPVAKPVGTPGGVAPRLGSCGLAGFEGANCR